MSETAELAGLAEAEAALDAAEDRRDSLQASLDAATGALRAAEQERERLVRRAAAGDALAGRETVKAAREITDRSAEHAVLTEALPGAAGAVRRAQRDVDGILGAERQRRAEIARQIFREAEQAVEKAAAEMDRRWREWQMLTRS